MVGDLTPLRILQQSINNTDFFQVFSHQEEALERYHADLRKKRDVVIELPTGSGKSFVLLAIAEYWLRMGKRVCVLAPNNQLAEQLYKEANRLKFSSVIIYRKRDDSPAAQANLRKYNNKEAFGITNYLCFFKHDLSADVLIFDDTHLLEDTLEGEFTYRFPVGSKEYSDIKEFLISNAIVTEEKLARIIKDNSSYPLNFLEERRAIDYILHSLELEKDSDNYWVDYYNADYAPNFLFFIHKDGFTLTPFAKPLDLIDSLSEVPHRIFLSATIPSKNQFIFSVGLSESPEVLRFLSMKNADYRKLTVGNRLILPFAQKPDGDLEPAIRWAAFYERMSKCVAKIAQSFDKVLILCQSTSEVERYKEYFEKNPLPDKLILTSFDKEFYEQFKTAKKGVLILANRYSGLDFPGDTCNVAVLTLIPNRCTPIEIFIEEDLNDIPFSEEKTAVRIVQAFGRCNRNKGDTGLYIVLDGQFYFDFNKQATFSKFYPQNLREEINLGTELYERNKTDQGHLDGIVHIGKSFLATPQIFEPKVIADKRPPFDDTTHYNSNLVKAWEFMLQGNFRDSSELLQSIIRKEQLNEEYKCWLSYLVARCEYYDAGMKSTSVVVHWLEEASRRHTSEFFKEVYQLLTSLRKEISDQTPDYQHFQRALETPLSDKSTFLLVILKAKDDFESGDHDTICTAVVQLMTLFGVKAKHIDEGTAEPDLIIKDIAANKGYIIEVKSKPTAEFITSGDIGQLKKHINGKHAQEFTEQRYILLSKKLKVEPGAQNQTTGIHVQYIEDYTKLIDQMLTNSHKKEKVVEIVTAFYREMFSGLK